MDASAAESLAASVKALVDLMAYGGGLGGLLLGGFLVWRFYEAHQSRKREGDDDSPTGEIKRLSKRIEAFEERDSEQHERFASLLSSIVDRIKEVSEIQASIAKQLDRSAVQQDRISDKQDRIAERLAAIDAKVSA